MTQSLFHHEHHPLGMGVCAITHTLRAGFGMAHSTLQTGQDTAALACSIAANLEHPAPHASAAHRH